VWGYVSGSVAFSFLRKALKCVKAVTKDCLFDSPTWEPKFLNGAGVSLAILQRKVTV